MLEGIVERLPILLIQLFKLIRISIGDLREDVISHEIASRHRLLSGIQGIENIWSVCGILHHDHDGAYLFKNTPTHCRNPRLTTRLVILGGHKLDGFLEVSQNVAAACAGGRQWCEIK